MKIPEYHQLKLPKKLNTFLSPLGPVKIYLDGKRVEFTVYHTTRHPFKNIEEAVTLRLPFTADGKKHLITCEIETPFALEFDNASGEHQEAFSLAYTNFLYLGVEGNFGSYLVNGEYIRDDPLNHYYDGNAYHYKQNDAYLHGYDLFLTDKVKSRNFDFALVWTRDTAIFLNAWSLASPLGNSVEE